MSTELRRALNDAVSDAPPYRADVRAIVAAGGRRARRRTQVAFGAGALAVAALLVVVGVVADPGRRDPGPGPAGTVRLDLGRAEPTRTDVLTRTRTAWTGGGKASLEWDRYDGLTTDGLVLRSAYTNARAAVEIGLLDPRTKTTDWLPPPPVRSFEPRALELTADRLVLAHGAGNVHLLVFDRTARTWQRHIVRVPRGIEVHVPPLLEISPDDRLYVGATMEGQSGPLNWWSAPVDGGGVARSEPSLEGAAVTWGDGVRVTADPSGRVVLSTAEGEEVVADRRPSGCDRPAEFPDAPVRVLLAGDRPVVTFICESETVTVVHEPGGGRPVQVAGATALAADDRRLVMSSALPLGSAATDEHGGGATYVLDLDQLTLGRLGPGPHDTQVALQGDLVLWNHPGPADSRNAYDVVWDVARLP